MKLRTSFSTSAILSLSMLGCSASERTGSDVPLAPSGGAPNDRAASSREEGTGEIRQVSVADHHVCAVSDGGKVYCWGRNDGRQIGDGTRDHRSLPTLVEGIGAAARVATAKESSCAVTRRGQLFCWGNVAGVSLERPKRIEGLEDVRDVAVGRKHACAIVGGRVRCWGDNALGQLGTGDTKPLDAGTTSIVSDIRDAQTLVAGASTSCALRSGGEVVCWGAERSDKTKIRTKPVAIAGLPKMKSIHASVHGDWVWALSNDGFVYEWGNHPRRPSEAQKVDEWSDVEQLAIAMTHRCAILKGSQAVQCAGHSFMGATGLDPSLGPARLDMAMKRETPPIHDLPGFVSASNDARLFAGGENTCLLDRGKLSCVGSNEFGQLGIGEQPTQLDPVEIEGLEGVAQVVPFQKAACALKTDGRVACWGQGSSAVAPPPSGVARRKDAWSFEHIAGLSGVRALVRGARNGEVCASKSDGDFACFEAGLFAFPGATDEAARRFKPHTIMGLRNVLSTARIVDANVPHLTSAYAVLHGGTVVAWQVRPGSERDKDGELRADVERKTIVGLSKVKQIVTSSMRPDYPISTDRACALHEDGTVSCFTVHGPFGELNRPTPDPRATRPELVHVKGVVGAVELTAAGSSFFARTALGQVLQWDTDSGAGRRVALPALEAKEISSLRGVTAMSKGGVFCVAHKDRIDCERDRHGVFSGNEAEPKFHIETGPAKAIEIDANMCVLKANGRVACWGRNRGGALGLPARDLSVEPQEVRLPPNATE